MSRFSRRNLLRFGGIALALNQAASATALGKLMKNNDQDLYKKDMLHGFIYGVGSDDMVRLLVSADAKKKYKSENWSVLVETDLTSGRSKYNLLPCKGHMVQPYAQTQLVCASERGSSAVVWDRRDSRVVHLIKCQEGFIYSGNCLIIKDLAYFPLRQKNSESSKNALRYNGMIQVVDLKTGKEVEVKDTQGYAPHELKMHPQTGDLLLSHYGVPSALKPFSNRPYYFNVEETALTVLDANSLKVKSKVIVPRNSSLSHFDVDKEGMVVASMVQFVELSHTGIRYTKKKSQIVDSLLSFCPSEIREGRLGVADPILKIDPVKGKFDLFMSNAASQRSSQSVVRNSRTNLTFVTYSSSDVLARFDSRSDQTTYLSAFDMGLFQIRGIADIPGSPFIAVNGQDMGLVILEASTLQIVAKLKVNYFDTRHLTWAAPA